MKLYTYPGSPVCRPIAMFIADHKLEVEQQVVDLMAGEQNQPAFAAINPNNAVPVLEDGAFRLTECSAILKYLADVVNSPEAFAGTGAGEQRDGLGQYRPLPGVWLQSLLPPGASAREMAGPDGPVAGIGRWADRFAKAARRHERPYVGRKQSLAVRG